MKKRSVIAIILAMSVILTLLAGCSDSSSAKDERLTISCTDDTGAPVSDVELHVVSGEADSYISTDSSGIAEIQKENDEYIISVASAPDEYLIPNEIAVLNDNNLNYSFTLLLDTSSKSYEEYVKTEKNYPIYSFDKLELDGEDFYGNKVDSSVFKNADVTWIKIYYYDKENKFNYSASDLELTKKLYDKYKDQGLQVIVVLQSLERNVTSDEAEKLAEMTDTDFLTMPMCDGLKPVSYPLDYVQNVFVNKSGNVIMPVEKDSEDLLINSERIAEYKKYAIGHFPTYAERLDETFPGLYTEEIMTKFIAVLVGDFDTARKIDYKLEKRRADERDISRVRFDSEDRYGRECDESIFSDYKLTMIYFWEGGTTCENEMYYLNELYSKYKDEGFQVLGVYSGDENTALQALNRLGILYPNIVKSDDFKKFSTGYVPTIMFVNNEGSVISHSVSADDLKDNPDVSEELLEKVYIGSQLYETWEKMITDYMGISIIIDSTDDEDDF